MPHPKTSQGRSRTPPITRKVTSRRARATPTRGPTANGAGDTHTHTPTTAGNPLASRKRPSQPIAEGRATNRQTGQGRAEDRGGKARARGPRGPQPQSTTGGGENERGTATTSIALHTNLLTAETPQHKAQGSNSDRASKQRTAKRWPRPVSFTACSSARRTISIPVRTPRHRWIQWMR